MSEYRDLRDEMETNQEKASEPIAQDGMYGWQSEIIHEKAENEVKVQPQQENEYYTYTGAYAERTYKDLKRAAKEARKTERTQKRAEHRGKRKKNGFAGDALQGKCRMRITFKICTIILQGWMSLLKRPKRCMKNGFPSVNSVIVY